MKGERGKKIMNSEELEIAVFPWEGLSQVGGNPYINDCLLEESCFGQKWSTPGSSAVLNFWQGAAQWGHGLSINTRVEPKIGQTGCLPICPVAGTYREIWGMHPGLPCSSFSFPLRRISCLSILKNLNCLSRRKESDTTERLNWTELNWCSHLYSYIMRV